jgi:hypothetical protein
MNSRFLNVFVLLVFALTLAACENASRSRTTRDAAIGAAAGAVIGGVIGHNSGDEAAEGAAIGAAVGAAAGAAGAAHGHARARDERRDYERGSYSDDDYRELLTDEEVDILRARARASGRDDYELTDFLTNQEKENLRRRDALRDSEIGR